MILSLISLAFSGFLSSTILPGSSEALFVAFLLHYPSYFILALIILSITNSLGSYTSFLLGMFIPKRKRVSEKAVAMIDKYGTPLLFFSFLPIIGDLLPIAAGWLRISILKSFLFIFLGKFTRYTVIGIITLEIS